MGQQIIFDPRRIGFRLIHFINSDNHRRLCRFGMINCLNGLRHHPVITGDHQNDNIGDFGTARAHSSKSGMARRIDKSDGIATGGFGLIGPDMLGDAPGLAISYFGFAERIQKRGFAVVNMAHHRHHRRTGGFIALIIISGNNRIFNIAVRDAAHLMAQILSHNLRRIGVNHIINLRHHTLLHQHFNDIDSALGHAIGQFLNGNRVGQLHGARYFLAAIGTARLTLFAFAAPPHGGQRAHALFIIQRIINGQLAGAATAFAATLIGGRALFLFLASLIIFRCATHCRFGRTVGTRGRITCRFGFGLAGFLWSAARIFGFALGFFFSAARIFLGAALGVNLRLFGFFNGAGFGFCNRCQTLFLLGF